MGNIILRLADNPEVITAGGNMYVLLALMPIAALICGLLYPVKIDIDLCLRGSICRIYVDIRFFYRIIKKSMIIKLQFTAVNGLRIMLFRQNGTFSMIFPKKRKKRRTAITWLLDNMKWLKIKKFDVTGTVGIADNAFYTAMLTGLLRSVLDNSARILLPAVGKDAIKIEIMPVFNKNAFRINMEGILKKSLIQNIGDYFKNKVRKGRQRYASH